MLRRKKRTKKGSISFGICGTGRDRKCNNSSGPTLFLFIYFSWPDEYFLCPVPTKPVGTSRHFMSHIGLIAASYMPTGILVSLLVFLFTVNDISWVLVDGEKNSWTRRPVGEG